MSRELPTVSQASCNQCGNESIELRDFNAEGKSSRGDKHIEIYACTECKAEGGVEYTPPTSTYTLKGPLFGEPEDVEKIKEEARNLN